MQGFLWQSDALGNFFRRGLESEQMTSTKVFEIFQNCAEAIQQGVLIQRVSRTDKEFHFQDWFQERIKSLNIFFEQGGRNSYPDFTLVQFTEGYEIKGLAYPGRDASYDCNSQVPTGCHNGRDVYYVFGRYPKDSANEAEYPVIDLIICHGDFLNADHDYIHENKSVKGFGSYGDILIRDRKMYVAPTPYAIADGLAGTKTLIVPDTFAAPNGFKNVGNMIRTEADKLVVGYRFKFGTNLITASKVPNPDAGKEHKFSAFRIDTDSDKPVTMS